MDSTDRRLSRRNFVGALSAALAATWVAPATWITPGARAAAGDSTPLRKPIPATGETLAVIGLGTSGTFDVTSDEEHLAALAEVLRAFFDQGGELIDSSPMYGAAEEVLGRLLARIDRPAGLFAATKVWIDGQAEGVRQMEESRRKWGVPRFDLMQIHNLRDWRAHLETLRAWQEEGRIRYVGITTSHGRYHQELEAILREEPLDFVQLSYNIADRAVEERLLPLAAERGLAVLVNRPFQRGELFQRVQGQPLPGWAAEIGCASWGQVFLKFVVSHPAVTCAIPATSKLRHLRDNMGAGVGSLPDAALRRRMAEHVAAL